MLYNRYRISHYYECLKFEFDDKSFQTKTIMSRLEIGFFDIAMYFIFSITVGWFKFFDNIGFNV